MSTLSMVLGPRFVLLLLAPNFADFDPAHMFASIASTWSCRNKQQQRQVLTARHQRRTVTFIGASYRC